MRHLQAIQPRHVVVASSPVRSPTIRKPGGVASLAFGDIVGRVSGSHSDSLGRWTAHHLHGKAGSVVTVVSLYQACKNTQTPNTVWNQQVVALAITQRSHLLPREAFALDIKAFLCKCTSEGHQLIVGGDFNSDFGNTGILHDLCSDPSFDLTDIIGLHHPEAMRASTFERSSNRIGHLLVSSGLVDSTAACGYLPFGEYVESDHRFSYIDLSTTSVFGDPAKLAPFPERDIQANNPALVTTYLEALAKYLSHQNFWPRLDQLKRLEEPNPDLAEKLDQILTDAKLHAEAQCRYDWRYWWSLPLAKAKEKVRFYCSALSALRQNQPVPKRSARRRVENWLKSMSPSPLMWLRPRNFCLMQEPNEMTSVVALDCLGMTSLSCRRLRLKKRVTLTWRKYIVIFFGRKLKIGNGVG